MYSVCLWHSYAGKSRSRHMPTYEQPTSYYHLAGETAPPVSNALFSPDGLIVN